MFMEKTLNRKTVLYLQVMSTWMSKYFNYADIRYLTLMAIEKICTSLNNEPGGGFENS